VFDEMQEKNEVSARCPVGRRNDAFGRFLEMRDSSSVPCDSHACVAAVTVCTEDASLLS
jgi:hypothetical protein